MSKKIVEKELGIPANYQYKAIRSSNYIQANWHRNKMCLVGKLIDLNKKMSVLDLGTGSGNFELLFSGKVKNIVGVDYNDEAIHFLRNLLPKRKIKNVNLILDDIRELNKLEKQQKYDLILMVDVIEHLNFEDVKNLFSNFRKYLKKNGKVLIITPNYQSFWLIIEYGLEYLGLAPKFHEHQHLSKLYKSNLLKLINDKHYHLEKLCTFNLVSYLIPFKNVSEKLAFWETKIPMPIGNLIAVVFSR